MIIKGSTGLVKLKRTGCNTKEKYARIIFLAIKANVNKTIVVSNGLFGNCTGQNARLKRIPLVTGNRHYTYKTVNYLRRCTSASTLMERFDALTGRQGLDFSVRVGKRLVIHLCRRGFPVTIRYVDRRFCCLKEKVTKFIGVFDPRQVMLKKKIARSNVFCLRGVERIIQRRIVTSYTLGARVMTTSLNGGTKFVKTTSLVLG